MDKSRLNRRDFIKMMGVSATVLGLPQSLQAAGKAVDVDDKPNLVIIFTDDQGYADLGCFGSKTIKTPRLDAMAKEGMKLTSFYSQPVCGPARTALMSSCYPMRVGRAWGGWSLPGEETTVAEVLKQAGYATCGIGKWDISGRKYVEDRVPNSQGFDYYFGTLGANDSGRCTLWRNRQKLNETSDMGSLTGMYTDEAINFIKQKKNSPFFLYLAHTMPHVKIDASDKFRGKSEGGIYGDVIEEIDFNVGRILDTLKQHRLSRKTIVLFTSDNGPWLCFGAKGGKAKPLRDGKGSCWEGGFRVPTILWGPGRIPAGKTSNEMMATLDILPTFAALAGANVPADRIIDGVNQVNLITGRTRVSARQTFYYYFGNKLHAVRKGKWKLAIPSGQMGAKYIMDKKALQEPELYNLEKDVSESKNVAADNPDVLADLLDLVKNVRQDIGDHDAPGKNARNIPSKKKDSP
ncbi:MAG: sulfatase family protein [Planctomycetota bacterium]|jgi:arylsulfatase